MSIRQVVSALFKQCGGSVLNQREHFEWFQFVRAVQFFELDDHQAA